MKQAFQADEVFTGSETMTDQVILIEGNIITEILPKEFLPSGYETQFFPGCMITPGFIDLQLYGGNGKLFSNSLDIESLESTYEYCVSGGCSHFMITMATNSMENFLKGIDAAGAYMNSGKKGLLGLHLEGPWISKTKKGAHVEAFIKKPTLDEVEHLLEKGKGIVKMITLAPEQCDDNIINLLMDNGILVSAGHSNATYIQASHAFRNGSTRCYSSFQCDVSVAGKGAGNGWCDL